MLVGPMFDLRGEVDKISMTSLGHLGTDGIVKELFDAGQTAPKAILNWYNEHSPNQIDKATYNSIYAANQPHLSAIYNETGFDPRLASAQAATAGVAAPAATDQAIAAASLPIGSRMNYDASAHGGASATAPVAAKSPLDASLSKAWAAAASPDETPAPPEPALTPAPPPPAGKTVTHRGGPS
jgi:hypothetical protein